MSETNTFEIERTDCSRCGGSGSITKMVHGRSGLVPCPDCDNIPQYAIPNDPPEDPHARLEEIEDELEAIRKRGIRAAALREALHNASEALNEAASMDNVIEDGTKAVLQHIEQQVSMVRQGHHLGQEIQYDRQGIRYDRERLREEKRKLQTLVDLVEERQEQTEEDQ